MPKAYAHRGNAARNALIGAGVTGIILWWLTKPATSATPQVFPAPYFPPTPPSRRRPALAQFNPTPQATTDCSSYFPATIDPSSADASGQLASFGACSGANALVQGVIDSSIVQSIEAAIEQGSIEAAQLTGIATIATQVVGAVAGVSVAAATSVMPIVGLVATAVFTIANWIGSLGGGPQIYVPNPNASGGDSITLAGITYEKINLSDYGGFVQNAMNWVNANPQAALSMTPQALSDQFSIFLDAQVPTQLASTLLNLVANPMSSTNVYSQLASGNPPPPGAYEILRAVQQPAAAAICAAMPTKSGYLTNYGGTGGMGSAPLQAQFPALKTDDMAAAFGQQQIHDAYETAMNNALDFVNAQCPPLEDPTVLTQASYKLALQDAVQLLTQWAPLHACPGYQAPKAQPGPQQCFTLNIPPFISQQVCVPGAPAIVAGSSVVGSAAAATGAAKSSLARGAAVAAGTAGAGLLLYHLYTGYSTLSTLRALKSDVVAGARKLTAGVEKGAKRLEHLGRRRNPLPVDPYRSSATGGRVVAYRVRVEEEEVLFDGRHAILLRREREVARFLPSRFQRTKIRAGRGELLIFQDQLGARS